MALVYFGGRQHSKSWLNNYVLGDFGKINLKNEVYATYEEVNESVFQNEIGLITQDQLSLLDSEPLKPDKIETTKEHFINEMQKRMMKDVNKKIYNPYGI